MERSDETILSFDGLSLPLRRLKARSTGRGERAVLLVHDAFANARTFTVPASGFAAHLLERGFEPWLLDWRGSGEVLGGLGPEHSSRLTLEAARHDVVAALGRMREVSPRASLSVVAHGAGAVITSFACATGLFRGLPLETLVLSGAGPFFTSPQESLMRADDHALERVGAEPPAHPNLDPFNPDAWPQVLQKHFAAWPKRWLPFDGAGDDGALRSLTYLCGSPFVRARVATEVHGRLTSLFGPVHLGLLNELSRAVRRGQVAPFTGPAGVLPGEVSLSAKHFDGLKVTLLGGRLARMWHPRGLERFAEWLESESDCTLEHLTLKQYGHHDLFWSPDAPLQVFPRLVEALGPPAREERTPVSVWPKPAVASAGASSR